MTYRCAPAVSFAATWCMKARVMPRPPSLTGRQHVQVQSGSMGEKSVAKEAWRRLRLPDEVMALPKRWMDISINDDIQVV